MELMTGGGVEILASKVRFTDPKVANIANEILQYVQLCVKKNDADLIDVLMTTLWISVNNLQSLVKEKELHDNTKVTKQVEKASEDSRLNGDENVDLTQDTCTDKNKHCYKTDGSSVPENQPSSAQREHAQDGLETSSEKQIRGSNNVAEQNSYKSHDTIPETRAVTKNNNGGTFKSLAKQTGCPSKVTYASYESDCTERENDLPIVKKSHPKKDIENEYLELQCTEFLETTASEKQQEMECGLEYEAAEEMFEVTDGESGQVPFKITNVTGGIVLFEDETKDSSSQDDIQMPNDVIIELNIDNDDEFLNNNAISRVHHLKTMNKIHGRVKSNTGPVNDQIIFDEKMDQSICVPDEKCLGVQRIIDDHNRVPMTGSETEPVKPLMMMTNIHNRKLNWPPKIEENLQELQYQLHQDSQQRNSMHRQMFQLQQQNQENTGSASVTEPVFMMPHLPNNFLTNLVHDAQGKFVIDGKVDFALLDCVIEQILQYYPMFHSKLMDLTLYLLGRNTKLVQEYNAWKSQKESLQCSRRTCDLDVKHFGMLGSRTASFEHFTEGSEMKSLLTNPQGSMPSAISPGFMLTYPQVNACMRNAVYQYPYGSAEDQTSPRKYNIVYPSGSLLESASVQSQSELQFVQNQTKFQVPKGSGTGVQVKKANHNNLTRVQVKKTNHHSQTGVHLKKPNHNNHKGVPIMHQKKVYVMRSGSKQKAGRKVGRPSKQALKEKLSDHHTVVSAPQIKHEVVKMAHDRENIPLTSPPVFKNLGYKLTASGKRMGRPPKQSVQVQQGSAVSTSQIKVDVDKKEIVVGGSSPSTSTSLQMISELIRKPRGRPRIHFNLPVCKKNKASRDAVNTQQIFKLGTNVKSTEVNTGVQQTAKLSTNPQVPESGTVGTNAQKPLKRSTSEQHVINLGSRALSTKQESESSTSFTGEHLTIASSINVTSASQTTTDCMNVSKGLEDDSDHHLKSPVKKLPTVVLMKKGRPKSTKMAKTLYVSSKKKMKLDKESGEEVKNKYKNCYTDFQCANLILDGTKRAAMLSAQAKISLFNEIT